MENKSVVILGAGAWGTALGISFCRARCNVTLLPKFEKEEEILKKKRINNMWLPGVSFPEELTIGPCFDNLKDADIHEKISELVNYADAIFVATPSQFMIETIHCFKKLIPQSCPIVICAKGFYLDQERQCGLLLSHAIQEIILNPLCCLSGPNFANEVATGEYSASVLSSVDISLAKTIAQFICSPRFKVFLNRDIIGVQIVGALKNVLAILCGIANGLKMGQNTIAVLFAQGIAEMSLFIRQYGGLESTLLGLVLGDVAMTCFSENSRNTALGIKIGHDELLQDLLKNTHAEGYMTVKTAYVMSRNLDIQTPVLDTVYNILYCDSTPEISIQSLLDSTLINTD
ncbi:MAG: NAD(P)H-dependent glycerol-3-phosphate dehydrogenase [Holosporales bacterium]|jgi:glycerol-3-phosphate dehydrogenase (NAD(P)+)|nr:NAD(P)H-dependent glycerol-3-phosphate dehydrogenase [Holosporales bacterium]